MAHSRDTSARVVPLRIGSLDRMHPKTASSVFWELDPLVAGVSEADPEIDKEAWLVARAFNHEPVGFSIIDAGSQTEVSILESAGFKIVADHPAIPRLRLTLPPEFDLLTAHEIADLLAEVPAQ